MTEVLVLTSVPPDRETANLFKLLYQKLRAQNTIFDPLGLFHEDP